MSGKSWIFGDDINTDVLAPGLYMKSSLDEMASHCLETVDPAFAGGVAVGDILVAGENFGIGSSREQAAQALQHLGIRTLVAKSFAGIFFRNALNFGLMALTCPQAGKIHAGDEIEVDAAKGLITNHSRNETYSCDVLPEQLMEMVRAGGLVAQLENIRAHGSTKDPVT